MLKLLRSYKVVEPHILNMILAGLFLQLINTASFLILNLYMEKQGYPDYHIANIVSYRFLAVMFLAFPLGLFIKGRALKPLFYISAIIVPFASLFIIFNVALGEYFWLKVAMFIWGGGFICNQIAAMPFILRYARKETHSEAITLKFATFSIAIFVAGMFNFILNTLDATLFDEQMLLTIFSFAGFASIYFTAKIKVNEDAYQGGQFKLNLRQYDWNLIGQALIPTFMIAVGAGLTIQFLNLFFFHTFGVDSNEFSLMGAITAILVFGTSLLVPQMRRRYGYRSAITLSQVSAIFFLLLMASTEFFSHYWFAVYIAVFAFLIRQPLMNMASPLTSELTMYYVGEKNQEMMSALTVSAWSGSWFISGQMFRLLRGTGMAYSYIFYITAALYLLGVILYYFLVIKYEKQQRKLSS